MSFMLLAATVDKASVTLSAVADTFADSAILTAAEVWRGVLAECCGLGGPRAWALSDSGAQFRNARLYLNSIHGCRLLRNP
jgi:hypothetical protein